VKVVQERLGHASAEITMNTYAHLWPDSEDKTRAAVDAELGKSDVSDPCQKHPVEK
jgi:integrase